MNHHSHNVWISSSNSKSFLMPTPSVDKKSKKEISVSEKTKRVLILTEIMMLTGKKLMTMFVKWPLAIIHFRKVKLRPSVNKLKNSLPIFSSVFILVHMVCTHPMPTLRIWLRLTKIIWWIFWRKLMTSIAKYVELEQLERKLDTYVLVPV